jgi:hypothetical protein
VSGFSVLTTYAVIDCYKCGALFAVPSDVHDELVDTGRTFYCPNGHNQHYTNSLQTKLENEREKSARLTARLDQKKAELASTERSRNALKGVVTKTKRRIAHGVCPCCNRTFPDLAAHMGDKHPDYVKDATPA